MVSEASVGPFLLHNLMLPLVWNMWFKGAAGTPGPRPGPWATGSQFAVPAVRAGCNLDTGREGATARGVGARGAPP